MIKSVTLELSERESAVEVGDIADFFSFGLEGTHKLIYVKDRKAIDILRGTKTERWIVGWVQNGNIYVLDKKNFEKESNQKYSDESYEALIKHEITHLFFSQLSKGRCKPVWLSEGVSIYVSGQLKFRKKITHFKNFLEFGEFGYRGVYEESGFVVERLIEKYGKQKLLELIRRLNKINSKEGFGNTFKEIYGFELNYETINRGGCLE